MTAVAVFLSIPMGAVTAQTTCSPKRINTHDCLPARPLYSYSLALPSDYNQAMCLKLGAWQGTNSLVVEWDELQAHMTIQGNANKIQSIQPKVRDGHGNAFMVYSDQPIFPEIQFKACERDGGQISTGQWLDPQQLAVQPSERIRPTTEGAISLSD
jgi:hypothetical protein